ncbi:MAG: hypothetical protein JWO77_1246 [Ilumatobacteraceae bacterium]|nr:hypothetical protein [Ilumatobacteraceae bacterium]
MTPPRSIDAEPAGEVCGEAAYDAVVAELAEVVGVINAAEGRVVALTARALELGVSGGSHLTPERWVEWQTGVTPGRASDVVKLAGRRAELPHTIAALEAGELSVDQAAAVARFVPGRFDASASRVASCCTVRQLRQALPWYRDPDPDGAGGGDRRSVSTGVDEHGWWIRGRLPEAEGAVVDQALKAMGEDLKRQARHDCPDGVEPERVTAADALVALAETALAAGEAVRPGSDRYLVHVHLQAGASGTVELMTHLGIRLPDGQRRHLLCDTRLRALVHDGTIPVGTGRVTRTINRRLRRAIEHRDRGCTVPGCGATRGLEIHHIWHWEDGGPTETWNLIALCARHHTLHHQGLLGIAGNADQPRDSPDAIVFTNRWGRPLKPTGQPVPPQPPATSATPSEYVAATASAIGITAAPYLGPTGERLDRWGFHLQADPPEPAGTADDEDEPPPQVTGQRPSAAPAEPCGPTGGAPIDPTRAGPTAV